MGPGTLSAVWVPSTNRVCQHSPRGTSWRVMTSCSLAQILTQEQVSMMSCPQRGYQTTGDSGKFLALLLYPSPVVCWPSLAPALTPVKVAKLQELVWQRNSCSSHLFQLPSPSLCSMESEHPMTSDKETKFYCDGSKPLCLFNLPEKKKAFLLILAYCD